MYELNFIIWAFLFSIHQELSDFNLKSLAQIFHIHLVSLEIIPILILSFSTLKLLDDYPCIQGKGIYSSCSWSIFDVWFFMKSWFIVHHKFYIPDIVNLFSIKQCVWHLVDNLDMMLLNFVATVVHSVHIFSLSVWFTSKQFNVARILYHKTEKLLSNFLLWSGVLGTVNSIIVLTTSYSSLTIRAISSLELWILRNWTKLKFLLYVEI